MKKFLFLIALIPMVLIGCDKIKSLADVTFQKDYTSTYAVAVTTDSVKMDQTIDLTSDTEIDKYKDKLQKITLDSLVLKVDGYNGNAVNALSGSLRYSDKDATTSILFASISNFSLSEGARLKLNPSQTPLADIQNILLTKKVIKTYLRGKTTGSATFTLKAVFYLSIAANAL